jgi:hypothetical protein
METQRSHCPASRLRQLTGHSVPFGGVAVVLAGDMRQLPPVSGQLWCADLVHSLYMYAPTGAGDGDAAVGSVDRGLAALRIMQLVQLTRLMRANGSSFPVHFACL